MHFAVWYISSDVPIWNLAGIPTADNGNKYLPMLITDPIYKLSTFQHIVLLYDQKKCKIWLLTYTLLSIANTNIFADKANIR